jgi:hypothetical protein
MAAVTNYLLNLFVYLIIKPRASGNEDKEATIRVSCTV